MLSFFGTMPRLTVTDGVAVKESPSVIAPARPALTAQRTVKAEPVCAASEAMLDEYEQLAKELGVASPDLNIERFKRFLFEKDIPIFNLAEVISYMDEKSAKESKEKAGWLWRPLREKDQLPGVTFGEASARDHNNKIHRVSCDHYQGPTERIVNHYDGSGPFLYRSSGNPVYDRTPPLHALKRIATIEKEYPEKVAFFVSDYAPEPAITFYPDPFLMAVIPNPALNRGEGRFVIDFWDEPGFGIERMLK